MSGFWYLSVGIVSQVSSFAWWLFGEGTSMMIPWSVSGDLWVMAVSSELWKRQNTSKFSFNFSFQVLTFLHNWKMANEKAVMKEKKDNWSAFHALSPRTPRASGIKVIAFMRTNTKRGMKSFFNFDLRAVEMKRISGNVERENVGLTCICLRRLRLWTSRWRWVHHHPSF